MIFTTKHSAAGPRPGPRASWGSRAQDNGRQRGRAAAKAAEEGRRTEQQGQQGTGHFRAHCQNDHVLLKTQSVK